MTKQIITESELKARIASLKETMAAVEDAASIGQTVGNVAGTAAGLASALPRAGVAAGQAVASKAGDLWNQAKAGVANAAQGAVQGVQNFAQGVAGGAKQGWAATDPAKMVGGGQQSAAKPGTTTGGKPDPAVMARQKELIAAGAQIKADGIAGPATAAAEQKFGGQAAVMAANAKDKAAAAAAPQATDQRVSADSQQGQMLAAQTAGMDAPAAAPAAAPATAPAAPTATESVYKDMDTLARIVQLSR